MSLDQFITFFLSNAVTHSVSLQFGYKKDIGSPHWIYIDVAFSDPGFIRVTSLWFALMHTAEKGRQERHVILWTWLTAVGQVYQLCNHQVNNLQTDICIHWCPRSNALSSTSGNVIYNLQPILTKVTPNMGNVEIHITFLPLEIWLIIWLHLYPLSLTFDWIFRMSTKIR